MNISTTALFVCLDDFARIFEDWEAHNFISTGRKRQRKGKLSLGEMLFIMSLFHLSPFKTFKDFIDFFTDDKKCDIGTAFARKSRV